MQVQQDTTVGVLGAGLSGVLMGMQLRRAGIDDFTIYEKQPDVGGTWLRNTYPGLHCDIPSLLYSYSFEPNPAWSMVYAGQAEIQQYVRACAEKYDLIDRIRFATTVEVARYDEEGAGWRWWAVRPVPCRSGPPSPTGPPGSWCSPARRTG